MTDRVFGFHVLLDDEYRIDDVQVIIDAVKMIKRVKDVRVHISTADTYYAYTNARIDTANKLMSFAKELLK